jgi:hypothetical protein
MVESLNDRTRAVGAMHCQPGSNANVYSLATIVSSYSTLYVLVANEPDDQVLGVFSSADNARVYQDRISRNLVEANTSSLSTKDQKRALYVQIMNRYQIIPITHLDSNQPIYVIRGEDDRIHYNIHDPSRYLTNSYQTWKTGQEDIGSESSKSFFNKCRLVLDPPLSEI